jgi:hypothetical protein
MGKAYDKRAALSNHARQAAQASMLLHGWQPIDTSGLYGYRFAIWHEQHGRVAKNSQGRFSRNIPQQAVSPASLGGFLEWDGLSTQHVLWLYKVLRQEKLL